MQERHVNIRHVSRENVKANCGQMVLRLVTGRRLSGGWRRDTSLDTASNFVDVLARPRIIATQKLKQKTPRNHRFSVDRYGREVMSCYKVQVCAVSCYLEK